jgi:hypothetical protein
LASMVGPMSLVSNDRCRFVRSSSASFPGVRADAVHQLIDDAHTVGEGVDRRVVGDVDRLGGDGGVVVGAGELVFVAAGDDDSRDWRCPNSVIAKAIPTILSCNMLSMSDLLLRSADGDAEASSLSCGATRF